MNRINKNYILLSSIVITTIGLVTGCNITIKRSPDIAKLNTLLSQEKWQEADRETDRLMDKSTDCQSIQAVDSLWDRYSNSKFGFTAQQEVWESLAVQKDFTRFGETVGWRRQISTIETINWVINGRGLITSADALRIAPKGHLPFSGWQMDGIIRIGFEHFMYKVSQCKSKTSIAP